MDNFNGFSREMFFTIMIFAQTVTQDPNISICHNFYAYGLESFEHS